MAKYTCKYCGSKTYNPERLCVPCQEKLTLIRQIKAMLTPTYERKKKNENQR